MNKTLFEEQLRALNFDLYDCLLARYNPEFNLTAQYIEKIIYKKRLSINDLLNCYEELNEYNKQYFNIYIRDSNYINSRIFVLDDIIAANERGLSNQVSAQFNPYTTNLFFLKTSTISKDKSSFQVVFQLHDDISILYKQDIMNDLTYKLEADRKHSIVNKYFRAAGFINQKPLENQRFKSNDRKNTLIEQKSFKP